MQEVPPEPTLAPHSMSTPSASVHAEKKAGVGTYLFLFFVGLPAGLFWIAFLFLFVLVTSLAGVVNSFFSEDAEGAYAYCNVARVQLHGVLLVSDPISSLLSGGSVTDADSFYDALASAEYDDTVRAIVLDVNSPGGTPVAGDEMLDAVLYATEKPVVAVVRDVGASAAYWAIAGADHIIASPVSDVGSIGVTMSYAESAGALQEEGGRWVDISSGDFKDAGHPERMLLEEERAHFQQQVDTVHEYMMRRILDARPTLTPETLQDIADGRAFLGVEALEYGLVDGVGGFAEALSYIEHEIGAEAVLCEPSISAPWWW